MEKKYKLGLWIFAGFVLLCTLCSGMLGKYANGYDRIFQNEYLSVRESTKDLKYGKWYARTKKISLPEGEYLATVSYRCSGGENRAVVRSARDQANISAEEAALSPDQTSMSFAFSLAEDTSDLMVEVLYGGGSLSVDGIEIMRTDSAGFLRELLLLAAVILLALFAVKRYGKCAALGVREREYFLLVCLAAVFAGTPLFLPYLINGHDMYVHLARIEGLADSLKLGQFPVRIQASVHGGYGAAYSIFYPELFLYIPAVLHVLGMSLVSAVQVFLMLLNLMAGAAMFHTARRIFHSARTGCMAGILYTLAIYRLCNMYTRFALGELIAMSFLPLVVCAVHELFWGDKKKWLLLTLSCTAIFQSHILSTLLVAAYGIAYALVCIRRLADRDRLCSLAKFTVTTLLLNLWSLIPLIQYCGLGITGRLRQPVFGRSLYLAQLLFGTLDAEGRGNRVGEAVTTMPLSVGLPVLIGCALFLALLYRRARGAGAGPKKAREDGFSCAFSFFLTGAAAAFMSTMYFPWALLERLPLVRVVVQYLQFSFRTLAFADVFLILAAAWAYDRFAEGEHNRMVVLVFAISVITTASFTDSFVKNDIYVYRGEIGDSYVGIPEYRFPGTNISSLRAGAKAAASEGVSVGGYEKCGTTVTFSADAREEGYVDVPLFWFPGYRAELDSGEKLELSRGENNVVRVQLPAGVSGAVRVHFEEFAMWKLADLISLLAACGLAVLAYRTEHRGTNPRGNSRGTNFADLVLDRKKKRV